MHASVYRKRATVRQRVLRLSIVVLALVVVPAATANKPTREIVPASADRVIDDRNRARSWISVPDSRAEKATCSRPK
jgi:hypothetical protein